MPGPPQKPSSHATPASQVGLVGTNIGLIIGNTIFSLPYVVITVMAVLRNYDERLDQAAWTLGATRGVAFRRITLPPCFENGLFSRNGANLQDLGPAIGEEPVADYHHLAIGRELTRHRFHCIGTAARHHDRPVGIVSFAEYIIDIPHYFLK